jgi:hypothetical protein
VFDPGERDETGEETAGRDHRSPPREVCAVVAAAALEASLNASRASRTDVKAAAAVVDPVAHPPMAAWQDTAKGLVQRGGYANGRVNEERHQVMQEQGSVQRDAHSQT